MFSSSCSYGKSSNCKRWEEINQGKYIPGYVMIEANLLVKIPHIIKSITSVIGF
jgi:transcription antitermination factor NusG